VLVGPARGRGAIVLELDIAGVRDLEQLERQLTKVFRIPYPSSGMQSIIDFGSSLDEWMTAPAGYCFAVGGVDSAAPEVSSGLAEILPFMIDRWRSIGTPYFAVLACRQSRQSIVGALQASNSELRRFGGDPARVAPSGPVPVYVDGVLDEETSAGAP
jgi:hypothetical protein